MKYAEDLGFKSVVVRTPDTDIFFILLHHANDREITIYVDIVMGKKEDWLTFPSSLSILEGNGAVLFLDFMYLPVKTVPVLLKGKEK